MQSLFPFAARSPQACPRTSRFIHRPAPAHIASVANAFFTPRCLSFTSRKPVFRRGCAWGGRTPYGECVSDRGERTARLPRQPRQQVPEVALMGRRRSALPRPWPPSLLPLSERASTSRLSRRSGGRPATSPHHRALARPYGCFKRLSPGPRRPACPRARARQPRTPRPASPPLPPRGGAAVERVGRRHRAYGCLGSRGLGRPSRLGYSPVPHCRHTALFTRAAGEVPAVSWPLLLRRREAPADRSARRPWGEKRRGLGRFSALSRSQGHARWQRGCGGQAPRRAGSLEEWREALRAPCPPAGRGPRSPEEPGRAARAVTGSPRGLFRSFSLSWSRRKQSGRLWLKKKKKEKNSNYLTGG